ncbi:MAG: nucleotide exchange factor GrpE [Promethearchaeota archaeon]
MTEGKKEEKKTKQGNKSDEKKEASKKKSDEAIKKKSREKKEDIKLLEEKEHGVLEFFSKDDLVKKCNELEARIKKLQSDIDALKKTLEKEQEEKKKWQDRYIHLQAEFENAQKRWDKAKQVLRTQTIANVIQSFLPLYDSFQKALENDNPENHHLKGFYQQFMGILRSYDAKPMNTKKNDPFDYSLHEALSSIEREDLPNNSIIDVIQEGWKIGKDVIRYAKVIISKKPKPPEPEPADKPAEKESEQKEVSTEKGGGKEFEKEKLKEMDQSTEEKEKSEEIPSKETIQESASNITENDEEPKKENVKKEGN